MQHNNDSPLATRRDSLTQVGGALGVATLSASASLADSDKPVARVEAKFEPVRIPEWVHGVTRTAFVTPGEVAKAAKAGVQVIHTNVVWP